MYYPLFNPSAQTFYGTLYLLLRHYQIVYIPEPTICVFIVLFCVIVVLHLLHSYVLHHGLFCSGVHSLGLET